MATDPSGSIRVGGVESVIALNLRRGAALRNPRKPMLQAVTAMFQAIQGNWANQGSDDGPWAPLARTTAARKERTGSSPLILIGLVTGARGQKNRGGSPGALKRDWDVTVSDDGQTGRVRSRHFYGTYHQLGTGKLTARHILPTAARQQDIAMRFFREYVTESVEEPAP